MPAIVFSSSGSFTNAEAFLQRMSKADIRKVLEKYGKLGLTALREATPMDTSVSAASWSYKVEKSKGFWSLSWHNHNRTSQGAPVVILIQYGHGTGTGGYVAGKDFINPAIKPLFDRIVSEVRKEVTRK